MEAIVRWLEGLGLGLYGEAFVEAEIDLAVLPDLSEQELEKLGVKLGHRKKLLRAIAALSAHASTLPASTPPPTSPISPEAERRQLTVMFCDLVGSTALSGRLDLEDLREVIGRYHACVAATVSRFDGFVAGESASIVARANRSARHPVRPNAELRFVWGGSRHGRRNCGLPFRSDWAAAWAVSILGGRLMRLAAPAAHYHGRGGQLLISDREQRDSRSYGLAVYVLPG